MRWAACWLQLSLRPRRVDDGLHIRSIGYDTSVVSKVSTMVCAPSSLRRACPVRSLEHQIDS